MSPSKAKIYTQEQNRERNRESEWDSERAREQESKRAKNNKAKKLTNQGSKKLECKEAAKQESVKDQKENQWANKMRKYILDEWKKATKKARKKEIEEAFTYKWLPVFTINSTS
jgi:hypothetical protein